MVVLAVTTSVLVACPNFSLLGAVAMTRSPLRTSTQWLVEGGSGADSIDITKLSQSLLYGGVGNDTISATTISKGYLRQVLVTIPSSLRAVVWRAARCVQELVMT